MGLSPSIMNDIISLDQNIFIFYNLRTGVTLTRRSIKATNQIDQSSRGNYQAT